MKTIWIAVLVFFAILGTLTIVANWYFPTGWEHYTDYINENGAREIARMPSPSTNPGWVQLMQNHEDAFIAVFICGLLISIVKLSEPEFPKIFRTRR